MIGIATPRRRQIPCFGCPLRAQSGFLPISSEALQFIERFKVGEMLAEPGTTLFVDGEKNGNLYTIWSGWGFRYKELRDGRRQILNYVLPGDFVGLQASLFDTMCHSIDTLTECVLCVFDRQRVFELFREHADLSFDVTWLAASDTRIVDSHLLAVGRRSAPERIAYVILYLHERLARIGLVDGATFPLPMTQAHLADTLGLSIVHTNKTLKRLTDRGLLNWRGGSCTLPDYDGLVHLAQYESLGSAKRPLI